MILKRKITEQPSLDCWKDLVPVFADREQNRRRIFCFAQTELRKMLDCRRPIHHTEKYPLPVKYFCKIMNVKTILEKAI